MVMSRRKRGVLAALAVFVALAATEVTFRLLRSPEASVRVENLGAEPIEDLVLTCGDGPVAVGPVASGGSAVARVSGRGPGVLRLSFRQRGNAMRGYELPGFDPAQMRRDGFQLVLRIRPNEVERYQDDAVPATPLGRLARNVWQSIDPLETEPLP
jgi:hypothetical protein